MLLRPKTALGANLSVSGLQLSTQNLILRCAKTQNLVRVLGMDHIFAPPGAPEIIQKSNTNRS